VSAVRISADKLVVPSALSEPVVVSLDGQYLWSFLPPRDGARHPGSWHVPWPATLDGLLRGTATVRLASTDGQQVHFEEPVVFAGSSEPLVLRDEQGVPLAVDRAGHLGRVFSETDGEERRLVVEGAARALLDLRAAGFDAHLSYGCLLGAVRDGRMIGHDTDADLAYLSASTHPADIALESFRMERAMRDLGWAVERMSGADLKLFLPMPDGRRVQIDVFGAFHVEDTFYQLGGRSGVLPREALTPASTVVLEGVELAAPADPERVLEFLYGAGWRVPDPAFQNRDPGSGVRRLDGWFRGPRTRVIAWNDLYRTRVKEVPGPPSSFARWSAERMPAGAEVVDLGCGTGRDTLFFAAQGHRVHARDYARRALGVVRRRVARRGVEGVDTELLILNDLRSVLAAGASLSRLPEPPWLHARDLVGCLDEEARGHLFLLCAMVLRRGGALHLEFAASRTGGWHPRIEQLVERRRVRVLREEIAASGGRVVHVESGPGEDFLGRPLRHVVRLEARWDTRPAADNPGGTMDHDVVDEAPTTRVRSLARRAMSVPARLLELEEAVQENRRLNRRIAELTDVVAELLVPVADRDEEKVAQVLERYRSSTFGG
jgi:SAM-dependent methyltransferase